VIRIGNSWAEAALGSDGVAAWDRLPRGCAILLTVVLSLLTWAFLWAIVVILLLRFFHEN
jgi:hypothetical protein